MMKKGKVVSRDAKGRKMEERLQRSQGGNKIQDIIHIWPKNMYKLHIQMYLYKIKANFMCERSGRSDVGKEKMRE